MPPRKRFSGIQLCQLLEQPTADSDKYVRKGVIESFQLQVP